MEHPTSQSNHSSVERLKKEILNELRVTDKKSKHRKLSWGSSVVTFVLIALTLLSVVQTVQSVELLNKVKSGQIKSSSKAPNGAANSAPLPSSLEKLPNMVGGC